MKYHKLHAPSGRLTSVKSQCISSFSTFHFQVLGLCLPLVCALTTRIQRPVAALGLACTLSFAIADAKAAATVVQVSAGYYNSLFVKSDGSLWAMGRNSYGELGENPGTNYTVPVRIVASNVSACALGDGHSLFRKSDGSLWTMGRGDKGQLGDGKTQNRSYPQAILTSGVTLIAAGAAHSLFKTVTSSRLGDDVYTLYGMGNNVFGQLGPTTAQREFPVQIRSSAVRTFEITAFSAGHDHSLFIQRLDRTLWAMGRNNFGQLGDGTTLQRYTPVLVASNTVAVAAGRFHTLFVKSDGSLWGMGDNDDGELGTDVISTRIPTQIVPSGVVAVAAGGLHSLFIKSGGSLWAMGWNLQGQLGDGSAIARRVPVLIVSSNVVAIAAGVGHSLFVKSDGSLWGMGLNGAGELGDGTTLIRLAPVPIVSPLQPRPSIAAIRRDGSTLVLDARGQASATYLTLTSTDLTKPLAQWGIIGTNQPNASGEFTITVPNAVDPTLRHQFFTLRLQD